MTVLKVTEIKPRDLNEEFPGLDTISRKVFDVSYADATPNLREHVRIIAKRDAAEQLYDALMEAVQYIPCTCSALPTFNMENCQRTKVTKILAAAEGRV